MDRCFLCLFDYIIIEIPIETAAQKGSRVEAVVLLCVISSLLESNGVANCLGCDFENDMFLLAPTVNAPDCDQDDGRSNPDVSK